MVYRYNKTFSLHLCDFQVRDSSLWKQMQKIAPPCGWFFAVLVPLQYYNHLAMFDESTKIAIALKKFSLIINGAAIELYLTCRHAISSSRRWVFFALWVSKDFASFLCVRIHQAACLEADWKGHCLWGQIYHGIQIRRDGGCGWMKVKINKAPYEIWRRVPCLL